MRVFDRYRRAGRVRAVAGAAAAENRGERPLARKRLFSSPHEEAPNSGGELT